MEKEQIFDLYTKKDKSIPQKLVMIFLEIVILAISYWILFLGGYSTLFTETDMSNLNINRHIILFLFNIVLFLRILITGFYLMKRHMPWSEALSIPFAFGLYYIGFALFGYNSKSPIDVLDIFAIFLYLLGAFLNTGSELMRDKWKKDPKNKGKLYTEGLFKYSMHINFFGDLLWIIAYALITKNWCSISIPIFIFYFFCCINIPKLDKYLAEKYKQEFDEYKKRTKTFIPFIY